MKTPKVLTLEEEIAILQKKGEGGPVSIEAIVNTLSGKGQSLILLILSLPFCQPIQIPGLSTPFGIAIAIVGLRRIFGRKRVWLPKRILAKKITPKTLQIITEKTLWLVKKLRRWVHPRLTALCQNPKYDTVNGILICILGLLLSLPLPIPFSNLAAAWPIFFIGLGILEDDGLFILLAYLISLFTFAFFFAIAFSIETFVKYEINH